MSHGKIKSVEGNIIKERKNMSLFDFGSKKKGLEFKFNLGDKVKDEITGFEGIIIARVQWLNMCNTYTVKPQTLKDGVPQDSYGFDEPQILIVEEKVFKANQKTGGSKPVPMMPNR